MNYREFAQWLPGEEDWTFAVRVLRQCRMNADRLLDPSDIDAFHAEPPATGWRGWDAVLAGVAQLTGAQRVSTPAVLNWCHDEHRFSPELFDPLDTGKYRWLEYMRTPIELRVRNIILSAGNLEGM